MLARIKDLFSSRPGVKASGTGTRVPGVRQSSERHEGGADGEASVPEALRPLPASASESETVLRPFALDRIQDSLFSAVRTLRADFADEGKDSERVLRTLTHRGNGTIRQIPWAAQSVLTMLRRRGLGINELTRVMEKDPALSQLLLRHANSAFYAVPGEPVMSIKRAIQRVGTEGVHSVVMFQVIQGQLSRPGGEMDGLAKKTWKHMVRTAPLCRDLAHAFGADPERAFTLGLLHDVGKLVFFDHVADQRKHLRRDLRLHTNFIGTSLKALHGLLGAMAVVEWGMDESAACAVMHHHTPAKAALARPMAEILYLGEKLDLAQARGEKVELEALWEAGELEGPLEPVARLLEKEPRAA